MSRELEASLGLAPVTSQSARGLFAVVLFTFLSCLPVWSGAFDVLTATNHSYPTTCAEEDNVNVPLTSNSKFGRHRATSGGCGARDRRAESLRPSGAPYPPYNGAGFVGWISAAHPPSASLPTRCWRRPPKFGTAGR